MVDVFYLSVCPDIVQIRELGLTKNCLLNSCRLYRKEDIAYVGYVADNIVVIGEICR